MEYLLGLLTPVVFFAVYQLGKHNHKPTKQSEAEKKENVIEKEEKLRKDFLSMMTYDVEKAMQGKKVTDGE
jgi:hypothetical protein